MTPDFSEITNKLIEQLNNDTAPWVRPWNLTMNNDIPLNVSTNTRYKGINVLNLWMAQAINGFPTGEWLTFGQGKKLGGNLLKGSKHTKVYHFRWQPVEVEGSDKPKFIPITTVYQVFNVAQWQNLKLPEREVPPARSEIERIAVAETFLTATQAVIRHGGDSAYYHLVGDYIQLPHIQNFGLSENYYAVAFHELGHWSGSQTRLKRFTVHDETNPDIARKEYAFEELVAELTAAFICAELGIPSKVNHALYLKSWAKHLEDATIAIQKAASQASKAADFLLTLGGLREEQPTEEPAEELEYAA